MKLIKEIEVIETPSKRKSKITKKCYDMGQEMEASDIFI